MSPGLFLISMSGSSAAAAADTVVRAADGRFAGSHRDTITDRYRHANLLCHGHRTAGACSIGDTSNGRCPLAGNGGGTHHSRRGQSQRGGNIHALRAYLIAAAQRTGLLCLIGQNGVMLISFTDTQTDPSFPGNCIRFIGIQPILCKRTYPCTALF